MKIEDFKKLNNEGTEQLADSDRRRFLKLGFLVTGLYLGGKYLSLTTTAKASEGNIVPPQGIYPYSPHYTMVIREHLCIDCELCKEACIETNDVPHYGKRTDILEKRRSLGGGSHETIFMPVLCNHCNRPQCVRVCPTTATWKDKTTGIVVMNPGRCIGCKTCMAGCPYNARYFKEEERYVDKCNFCLDTRLNKGEKNTACAAACPAEVRIFGDLTDQSSRVHELLHTPETIVWVLRPESGSLPNVYYTNA